MQKPVFAEISEDGRWVEVYFTWSNKWVSACKAIRAQFVPVEKGGPYWKFPLDFETGRDLALRIGKENLQLGAALHDWAVRERDLEAIVIEMLAANDAELDLLPDVLPKLADTLRPDQRVGAAYAALVDNPLIADEMGLGKTLEAIAGITEAGRLDGFHLIVAPVTSVETVWQYELERWQPHPVVIATGEGMGRAEREKRLATAAAYAAAGDPFWCVVNPDMVRFVSGASQYPFLHAHVWDDIVIDEIAKRGVRHRHTATAKGIFALKGDARIGMTGTPFGGRPRNLWGILHYLHPERFRSEWAWIYQWLETLNNGFGTEVGDVRPERREEFDRHLLRYMIHREKKDVLPDLPPKQRVNVWCRMTKPQATQYKKFAHMAELRIGEHELQAANVLAEYMRLKQFAGARQEVKEIDDDGHIKLKALADSGKLNTLIEKFEELGILDRDGNKLVPGEDEEQQAVVFSQFSEMIDMLYDYFAALGLPVLKITGATTKKGSRAEAMQSFQGGEARVMFMTTQAGGVSITLDRASNVFLLDETWDPDDSQQAEDRCHRASRIHQVTCYYLRSKGTVEEYIKEMNDAKKSVTKAIYAGQVRLYEEGG